MPDTTAMAEKITQKASGEQPRAQEPTAAAGVVAEAGTSLTEKRSSQSAGYDGTRERRQLRFASESKHSAEAPPVQTAKRASIGGARPSSFDARFARPISAPELTTGGSGPPNGRAQPPQATNSIVEDADEQDPRIVSFEQFCRRLRMPKAAIKSWRDTVSMPWLLAPFHTALAPATMALVVVTYVGGTSHLSWPRQLSLYIITFANVLAHACSFAGVWCRGPQYIEKYPKLAGSQLAVHVVTSSYLEWSLLLATETTLPYQNRFAFLALLTLEHWCGFASAISGGVPWDKHLRSTSIWPILWNASLRTAKGADVHSSLMYCRLLYDKVC